MTVEQLQIIVESVFEKRAVSLQQLGRGAKEVLRTRTRKTNVLPPSIEALKTTYLGDKGLRGLGPIWAGRAIEGPKWWSSMGRAPGQYLARSKGNKTVDASILRLGQNRDKGVRALEYRTANSLTSAHEGAEKRGIDFLRRLVRRAGTKEKYRAVTRDLEAKGLSHLKHAPGVLAREARMIERLTGAAPTILAKQRALRSMEAAHNWLPVAKPLSGSQMRSQIHKVTAKHLGKPVRY